MEQISTIHYEDGVGFDNRGLTVELIKKGAD